MGAWQRVRAALGVSFLVYVATGLAAVQAGLPLAIEAERWLGGLPWSGALRVEHVAALFREAPPQLVSAAVSIAILGLLGPWLQMAWLSALSGPGTVGEALRQGARFYGRALLTSLLTLLMWSVPAGACAGAAYAVHLRLAEHPDARLHDLAVLAACSPLLLAAALGLVWHDLARCAALSMTAPRAAWRGLRLALKPRLWLSWLAWALAGVWLTLMGDRLAALAGGELLLAPAVASVQLAALGRTVLRSRWLATAVSHRPVTPMPMFRAAVGEKEDHASTSED